MGAQAEQDVVADRQRQRVGPLEDHAQLFAHLDELCLNLIENAIKYNRHAGGRLDLPREAAAQPCGWGLKPAFNACSIGSAP